MLRYHGGKWMLAPWIISFICQHRAYIDIFGGGGSVLIRKERSFAEVYNDTWDTVVNVFRVMRDPILSKQLEECLRLTPYSRTEFDATGEIDIAEIKDPVEKARRALIRSFMGFGSASTNAKHSTGFRSNSDLSGTTPAHDWQNYPDNVKMFCERLQGVVIENRDYKKVLEQHDKPKNFIYADPPYVHETRNMKRGNAYYAFELTDDDHVEMCERFIKCDSMVMISGYDNEIYQHHLKDWTKVTKETFADGASPRVECLWLKPNIIIKEEPTLFI